MDACLRIGGIFVVWFMLMYGNFRSLVYDRFSPEYQVASSQVTVLPPEITLSSRAAPVAQVPSSTLLDEAMNIPWSLSVAAVTERMYSYSLEGYLQDRLQTYQMPFSFVPPGKRLRIHRLWVEAPLVDVSYASETQLEKWAFHDELQQGVVKYPFTWQPWTTGNMLIFWHSSVDFWESKSNQYGFVFSKLNELVSGDIIEVIWDGQQYLYEVQETVVKNPKKVNEVVDAYQDGSYLTLMACFPLYSTAQRILVIAKRVDPTQLAQRFGAFN